MLCAFRNANINERDDRGDTPLHIASENGNEEAVEVLLRMGAQLDAVNMEHHNMPIHSAASNGHAG